MAGRRPGDDVEMSLHATMGLSLGALALLTGTSYFYLKASLSRQLSWPRTLGVIKASKILFLYETFRADISYTYDVAGKELTGTTVRSLLLQYNWKGPATRLCERYPHGAKVDVYYSPVDPRQSVLKPGGDPFTLAILLVVALAAGLSSFGIILTG